MFVPLHCNRRRRRRSAAGIYRKRTAPGRSWLRTDEGYYYTHNHSGKDEKEDDDGLVATPGEWKSKKSHWQGRKVKLFLVDEWVWLRFLSHDEWEWTIGDGNMRFPLNPVAPFLIGHVALRIYACARMNGTGTKYFGRFDEISLAISVFVVFLYVMISNWLLN